MMHFQGQSVRSLLELHADLLDELRRRNILRTSNNPTGDYAEWLFARAFRWTLTDNSKARFDALDARGSRYQIKCRRVGKGAGTRQLGALRGLPDDGFDYLAGLLLNERYRVHRAAIVPIAVVRARAVFTTHTNAWRFMLDDAVWGMPGVVDVTQSLRDVEDPA